MIDLHNLLGMITLKKNMTTDQVEILVMDSAVENQKLYVLRCKRREEQTKQDRIAAEDDLHNMRAKLQYMRDSFLRKGCV